MIAVAAGPGRRCAPAGASVATTTGLAFPGVTNGLASEYLGFGWGTAGGGSNLVTATAPMTIYPATYIRRVFDRGGQEFFAWLFHANDLANNSWDGGLVNDYYGAHLYNNEQVIGAGNGPRDEISAFGGDQTLFDDASPAKPTFGSYPPTSTADAGWRTQVFTARTVGSNYEYKYYPNWPDTTTAGTITVSQPFLGQGPYPILIIGDAPWNRGNEIGKGIIRGLQFYDAYLSLANIASEIATPGSVRTPWYYKPNPTHLDITDESGQGHHPSFVNANRPTTWTAA